MPPSTVQILAVGGPAMLRERNLPEPAELAATIADWRDRGAAVLHVIRDNRIVGALVLEDQIRPESETAIDELRKLGVRSVMISGAAQLH